MLNVLKDYKYMIMNIFIYCDYDYDYDHDYDYDYDYDHDYDYDPDYDDYGAKNTLSNKCHFFLNKIRWFRLDQKTKIYNRAYLTRK